jgi:hypothetical protein
MRRTWHRALPALALAATALAAAPASAAASGKAEVPVEEFTLDNGMRFLVVRRPEQATVMAGWVAKVGSANERPGITGVAHFFEHMMFKGSRTIGTTDIARDLELMEEQEALQEKIRAQYRIQRERYRRGEIDDPFAAETRTPELVELERQFQALVEAQRAITIKDEFDKIYTEAGASGMNATTNPGLDDLLGHGAGQQARAVVLDGVRAAAAAGLPRVLRRARRGAGGAPPARRVDAHRAVRRAAQRHVLDLAPLQVGHPAGCRI